MMEYSKCPLKKRPIFVIKEEEPTMEEEDGPLDLTIKKPLPNIYRHTLQQRRYSQQPADVPLNFSTKLETITEEDYYTTSYTEVRQTQSSYPQDLSPQESYRFEYEKKFKSIDSLNEEAASDSKTTDLNRNFNNNFVDASDAAYQTNYSKMLRTSPISPSTTQLDYYTPNAGYCMEIDQKFTEPQDLTWKVPTKSAILSVRNLNIPNEMSAKAEPIDGAQNDMYYRCNTCTKCYSTLNGLIKHQQTHMINNEQNYINVIEDSKEIKNFIASANLGHAGQHAGDTNGDGLQQRVANIHRYQCKDCGKSYSTCSGLTKHQQFHCPNAEGNQVKKVFSCKNCDKVYVSLGALKMHIRTHTLPCKCPQCGKAFSRPWLLQGHIRTHTGEKPFSCQHCNRAFADRSNLRAHLQTHSDIKKYSCQSCTKTFSRMSLLGKHLQSGCPGISGKANSSSESNDENSSHLYQNNNNSDFVENNNTSNNNNYSNNNNNSAGMYDSEASENKQINVVNMSYLTSVIKGPGHFDSGQNYQPAFESY